MCIAVPMKLVAIDEAGKTACAVFSGNEMKVNISLIDPKPGDYVLVHAGCALEIVRQETAEEILDLFAVLEEI